MVEAAHQRAIDEESDRRSWVSRHSGAGAKRSNPEPRDSGFDALHRPGMTNDAANQAATTSSLTTTNFARFIRPKLVVSATSAASRPVAIRMRPIRGWLWRASKVYHWPER